MASPFLPWDSPGKNTGVGCHFLLQGIFPIQRSNPVLPYCRQTLWPLHHQGSPILPRTVATWEPGIPGSGCRSPGRLRHDSLLEIESPGRPRRDGLPRESRDDQNNRQLWPWSTKEAEQRPTEFCQENMLVIANIFFQQCKRGLYTWTSQDGQLWSQIDYVLCS